MAAINILRTLLLAFTDGISRHQAEVIEYLLEEALPAFVWVARGSEVA